MAQDTNNQGWREKLASYAVRMNLREIDMAFMLELGDEIDLQSREEGYNEAITHKQYEGRCESCNLNKVSHHGTKELCCICHVSQGNIPSDWHSNCMLAHKIREDALKEHANL